MTGVEKRTAVIKRLKKELKKRSKSSEAVKTNKSNLASTSNLAASTSNLAASTSNLAARPWRPLAELLIPPERDDAADKAKHNEQIDKIATNKEAERMQQKLTQTLLDRYGAPDKITTEMEKKKMTQTIQERYGPKGMPTEVAKLLEIVGANPLPPGPPPAVPAALA